MEEQNYKLIPLLRYFSLILLFLAFSAQAGHNKISNIDSAIYVGDAEVNVGEPFTITCIISIFDPIQWLKDGEIIYNLRHVKDDYTFTENNYSEAEGSALEITPNYQIVEHKAIAFDERDGKPIIIKCNISPSGSGNNTLQWSYNKEDIVQSKAYLDKRVSIDYKENTINITKPVEEDAGLYNCALPSGESADINVIANVYIKNTPHNVAVVEGEKLTLNCIVFGTNPTVNWIIGNETYKESRDRIVLKDDDKTNVKNAFLIINATVAEDRATYNCTANNLATESGLYPVEQEYIYVRVKGKLAALWPFLGICAEVFILCAIILVYEKRRNKAEMDESDTDQSPEQKNDHQGKDSDIRQRK